MDQRLAHPGRELPLPIMAVEYDTAVGIAYPLASRIMLQMAAALGDAHAPFGGMGRNGAQHTPEALDDTLAVVGHAYADLPAGKTIRNLNGDGPNPIITSHGDVAKPEIAWASRILPTMSPSTAMLLATARSITVSLGWHRER
ncbi:MAG: hypothetical protein M3O31_10485 [Acidobacteriota bacterium]|nr:hypothetical protein [Acidobacteriota bacterium]